IPPAETRNFRSPPERRFACRPASRDGSDLQRLGRAVAQRRQVGDGRIKLRALAFQFRQLPVGELDPDLVLLARALLGVEEEPLADFLEAEAEAAAAQDQGHPRDLARAVEAGA